MRRLTRLCAALLALGCGNQSATEGDLPVHRQVGLSPPLHIDRIFKSMEGPQAETDFRLGGGGSRELLWITGYKTEVVDADGNPGEGLSEFMCHNNVDFDSESHRKLFGLERTVAFGRMFTASQGIFGADFPDGFGIPLLSDEPLRVTTQVLNHNRPDIDIHVRHRITVEYVRDADAKGRLKPLYPAFAPVMALVQGKDGFFGVEQAPEHHMEGSSCAPGIVAPNAPQGTEYYIDPQNRVFTQHWVVPPGREDRHTLVTKVLNVPFDTTLHYINAHLHPYATTLELRDLTADKTLFQARAFPPEKGVGLARVEDYSSAEGIPVFRDHDYEIVSVYDNPTGAEQDAMAVFFVYFRDVELEQRIDALRGELAASASADASRAEPGRG